MMFDTTDTDVDMAEFQREDWDLSIYGNVNEEIMPIVLFPKSWNGNMSEPRDQGFTMTVYVDCDLGDNCVIHRSKPGFYIFLKGVPIYGRSAKQQNYEVRTLGSEFTATKQAVEYVHGLRYKLQMTGILCEDPDFVYGKNKLVLTNTTVPASTLKKNMNSLSHHFFCEGCAQDEWYKAYVNTDLNLANLLTKPLPSEEKQWGFVIRYLYWL